MVSIEPGLHFKQPYAEHVSTMSIQVKKYAATAEAASKDLQDVTTQVTLNYKLDPAFIPWILVTLGAGYEDTVIQPSVQEVVKQITAIYEASDLVLKREVVKGQIEEELRQRLNQYHIIVVPDGVAITDFRFSKAFSDAVDAKTTAKVLRDKAANDLERIEIEAKQKIAQAQADKQYATTEMIELKKIELQTAYINKWNGVLPQYVIGEGGTASNYLLNIGGGIK
jgi:regulator of protease activity HflC (stomatin/prohibitin superfamily)